MAYVDVYSKLYSTYSAIMFLLLTHLSISSSEKPRLCMISHWCKLAPPPFAATLLLTYPRQTVSITTEWLL